MKALLSGLLLATLAWLPGPALAADTPQAGVDYVEIAGGQPWAARAGRIEVAEVFGYTCPHCARFEPMLREWKARQPRDVDLVPVPAAFGGSWDTWARAYFAAAELDLLSRTHDAVFAAIHGSGELPRNPSAQELARFYARYGVSEDRFREALAEPSVDERIGRARAFARDSGLEGTPTLIVAGRYRVVGRTLEDSLRIADWLVARERQAPAGR